MLQPPLFKWGMHSQPPEQFNLGSVAASSGQQSLLGSGSVAWRTFSVGFVQTLLYVRVHSDLFQPVL